MEHEALFLSILTEELIPAMGCTEPIALAYAAARAREHIPCDPERIVAKCSGNMIKNVRCVRIPNSGGMTGIEAACVLGALCGDVSREMEVLEAVTPEGLSESVEFIESGNCIVEYLESPIPLHFIIHLENGEETSVRKTTSLGFAVGDTVTIREDVLFGVNTAVVTSISADLKKVNVTALMFGRETPIELDAADVKPLK